MIPEALDALVQPLAWTILHSLWQLALLGGACAAILSLLDAARPEVRERVCLGTLAAALFVCVWTFLRQLGPGDAAGGAAGAETSLFLVPVASAAPTVAFAWLLGVLASIGRLLAGVVGLRRWVRSAREDVQLSARVQRVAERLGIRRAVRALVSARVLVPATVGVLRPVLLLPIGLTTALSPREVEMVLAHELAHVRRLDFLVNLLVTVVEGLLFHHPAVWWVARRLRIEREFCCDDLAVSTAGRARDVATALAALEAHRHQAVGLSLSANGGSLMIRIRRLLDPKAATGGRRVPALAGAGVALVLGAALAAPSVACDEKHRVRVVVSKLPATVELEIVPETPLPEEVTVRRRYGVAPQAGVPVPDEGVRFAPPEGPEPDLAPPRVPRAPGAPRFEGAPATPAPPAPPPEADFDPIRRFATRATAAPPPPESFPAGVDPFFAPAGEPAAPSRRASRRQRWADEAPVPTPPARFFGRVVDAQGRPIEGAIVVPLAPEVDGETPEGGAATDADGRFEWVVPSAPRPATDREPPPATVRFRTAPSPSPARFPAVDFRRAR